MVLVSRYSAQTIGWVYGPVAGGEAETKPAVAEVVPLGAELVLVADLPQPAATTSAATQLAIINSRRVLVLVILVCPPVAGAPTVDSNG